MIRATYSVDSNGRIKTLELCGHANYYVDSGADVVCAAASTQVISVENSLHQLVGIEPIVDANEDEGGFIKITMPDKMSDKELYDSSLLMDHLVFSLEVMANTYPEYITIKQI